MFYDENPMCIYDLSHFPLLESPIVDKDCEGPYDVIFG